MFIDECVYGIDQIMHCDDLIATPINLGSSELIKIEDLVTMAAEIGGIQLEREHDLTAPRGVAGRNSDNTMIKRILGWEPHLPFRDGLEKTYAWIEQQVNDRKAGKRTVS
jgi:nucleoside-diphosphate-sugar epimerase